jgi:hypothetical protein
MNRGCFRACEPEIRGIFSGFPAIWPKQKAESGKTSAGRRGRGAARRAHSPEQPQSGNRPSDRQKPRVVLLNKADCADEVDDPAFGARICAGTA